MKLKDYLDLREPGDEITCWDRDIDSEFYFYTKEVGEKSLYGDDFPNVDKLDGLLKEHLDVVKIRDDGVEVNLYEFLENPKIVEFAKKHMFDARQYEDDSDVSLLLFDDNVVNFSNGFEGFSELMTKAIEYAFGMTKELQADILGHDFTDDDEKMRDFMYLSKTEFLGSYSYLTEAEYDATMARVKSQIAAMGLKAVNIKWDVDYDEDWESLPTEVDIPKGMVDLDEISDYLSEVTGFCSESFMIVDKNGERVEFDDNCILKFGNASLDGKIMCAEKENPDVGMTGDEVLKNFRNGDFGAR